MTQRQQFTEILLRAGLHQKEGRSSKYLVFAYPGIADKIYVGKAGALRLGRTANKSRAFMPVARKALLDGSHRLVVEGDSFMLRRIA